MPSLNSTILLIVIPLIVAPLTTWLMNVLKKMSAWVDAQTPTVKQILVALIAIVLNWVGLKLGVSLPTHTSEVTVETVAAILNGILSAFAAMGIYHLKDASTPISALKDTSTYERDTTMRSILLCAVVSLVAVSACESKKDAVLVDTTNSIVTTPVRDTVAVETKTTMDTIKKTNNVPAASKKPVKKQ